MNQEKVYWYAARTRDKQELSARKSLHERGVECFIPTRRETKQLKTRTKEVETPIIRNLIFVHTTKQHACDLHNQYRIPLYYITDLSKRGMLVVPDKQMHDFMLVMDLTPDAVSFDTDPLEMGDRVAVVKGNLAGLEGIVASDTQRTYVVLRIHGVLTASIKVPKSYLKLIKE